MSQSKKLYEARRWLKTAEEDLEAAQVLFNNRIFAFACFHAQQSGEKAMKALWYRYDHEPWGHSILRLVSELSEISNTSKLNDWVQCAASLDRYYIPTRYPNGLPDLTPGQSYFQQDAESALAQASYILEAVKNKFG